jgi:hypothetical protein
MICRGKIQLEVVIELVVYLLQDGGYIRYDSRPKDLPHSLQERCESLPQNGQRMKLFKSFHIYRPQLSSNL